MPEVFHTQVDCHINVSKSIAMFVAIENSYKCSASEIIYY
jgi:hypothetical protein